MHVTNTDRFNNSYEKFLAAYNPALRKERGVFYTPSSIVQYIIRSIADVLRKEFHLHRGFAEDIHILDPAVGMGTFFFEVINEIRRQVTQENNPDDWEKYVTDNLLRRLHGYEILYAPYLLTHLKFTPGFDLRWGNALDPRIEEFKKYPFVVILGNPPYNVSTANQNEYAKNLIAPYKIGLEKETNIQPLSDDYIKFIALGQQIIGSTSQGGVLAYITNNSFLDGVIHWRMRESLLETFDKIYILNLHGNTRKKETTPNGGRDENVFKIMQGTSVNIFIRNPAKPKKPCKVYYADLYGTQKEKFEFLKTYSLSTTNVTKFMPTAPDYFFIPKDFSLKEEYNKGFGVQELFIKQGTGIKFRKDNLFVKNHFTRQDVETMLQDIIQLDDDAMLAKYQTKETNDWTLKEKRQYFLEYRTCDIVPVLYRVFDERWTYYPMEKISQIIVRGDARRELMRHLFQDNLALLTLRNQPTVQEFDRVFIAKGIIEHCVIGRGTYAFPLYYYEENGTRKLNFNEEVVKKIEQQLQSAGSALLSPLDIFDYIYGVLHDPQYRARYQEFLKMDFPRVPYPKDAAEFDRYVQIGSQLRKLHLLEEVPEVETSFPISGSNVVQNVHSVAEKVFINETQYFANVPDSAWHFSIGGSSPAQKYLKDRKGRVLSIEEIQHYQKIIAVLKETLSVRDGSQW
ncbi:MAG: N-6 DNA methylase [Planctomycetaceae bacterium]|jgi:predicted helicase|nr:N-6 DNA methylase [Planctomycetaceae bacterium]